MSKDHDQGSFLTGFTVGLFAGAASYFLFATDKGSKVRTSLLEEWEIAREKLNTQGVIKNKDISLREVIKDAVEAAAEKAGMSVQKKAAQSQSSKKSTASKKSKKSSTPSKKSTASKSNSRKFKGV